MEEHEEGKYAQAEPLYHQRSLAIYEKAFGPDHPNVAVMLENYAASLRKIDRDAEAEKMEARAQAIRAKRWRAMYKACSPTPVEEVYRGLRRSPPPRAEGTK